MRELITEKLESSFISADTLDTLGKFADDFVDDFAQESVLVEMSHKTLNWVFSSRMWISIL